MAQEKRGGKGRERKGKEGKDRRAVQFLASLQQWRNYVCGAFRRRRRSYTTVSKLA